MNQSDIIFNCEVDTPKTPNRIEITVSNKSSVEYKKRQYKIYAHFMIHMQHAYDTEQIQCPETPKSLISESSIINSSLITVQL